MFQELKNLEYSDLEDMVFRMELTYHAVADILDTQYIDAETAGCTLPAGIYESNVIKLMLKSLLPVHKKVNFTFDDIRLRSNLTTNETKKFTTKSFF